MKKIIAKMNFTSNIGDFIAGDEISNLNYNQIVKLNKMGFIEPLSYKDLITLKREFKKISKKEEENYEI